ncbi:hypothetical protein Cni_G06890 [Canna indica]|uniref:Uncharacterized protein n=1 Tax=Canna indica TaxID=4628 RepID=A0AAQ3K2R4_9LILI|nr:hypothetical protein Cni_G06890 [Canna indica]
MKPDWLRSIQLWNQEPNTYLKVEPPKKPIAVNVKSIDCAFRPFDREKRAVPPPAVLATADAVSPTTSDGGNGVGGGGASGRDGHQKMRRCWSCEPSSTPFMSLVALMEMVASERSIDVRLAASRALYNALGFPQANFSNDMK